ANQPTFGAGYVAGDMTNGTVEPHFVRSFQIYDSLGSAHTITLNFLRTGTGVTPNEWTVEITADTDGDGVQNMITSAIVGFNSDGTLDMGTTTLANSISIPW